MHTFRISTTETVERVYTVDLATNDESEAIDLFNDLDSVEQSEYLQEESVVDGDVTYCEDIGPADPPDYEEDDSEWRERSRLRRMSDGGVY